MLNVTKMLQIFRKTLEKCKKCVKIQNMNRKDLEGNGL